MKSKGPASNPEFRVPVAGLLAWVLPGAGHLFIGERTRGVIFMTAIAVTFWGGVAIGGVKNTVNPRQRSLWFLAQISAGSHTLAALAWSKQIDAGPGQATSTLIAYNKAEELSVVYTAICGMLNLLIILDVLVRAEKWAAALPERAAGKSPEGVAMMDVLATFMIHPLELARWQQMLLLLPLCLTISVVYKTTRCAHVREIPLAAVVSWLTIVVGMYAVGVVLLLIYELAT